MNPSPRRGDTSATPTPTRVVVTGLEPNPRADSSSLKGFASVRLDLKSGSITIERNRIVQQPGAATLVSPPVESWKDAQTGETRYRTLVKFPPAWQEAVEAAVLAAWESYQRDGILPGAVIGGRRA